MKSVVVDASVAVKWFLSEIYSAQAHALLNDHTLYAPDLLFIEVASVLRTRVLQGELEPKHARNVLTALGYFPLHVTASPTLIRSALEIALETKCSIYDAIYLALAVQEKVSLVTADQKFFKTIQSTSLRSHVILLTEPG